MSDKNIKLLRKQIRNVVQDILPGLLTNEAYSALFSKLQVENTERLNKLDAHLRETLTQMDTRTKDVQAFIMNQVNTATALPNVLQPAIAATPAAPEAEENAQ